MTEGGGRKTEDGGRTTEDGGRTTDYRRRKTDDRRQSAEDGGRMNFQQRTMNRLANFIFPCLPIGKYGLCFK